MKKTAELLMQHDKIALIAHIAPDGDAVGATAALYYALKGVGKQVSLFCDDAVPALYEIIIDPKLYSAKLPQQAFEVAVAVDCADIKRVGRCYSIMEQAQVTLNIDHHFSNPGFAQHNVIRDQASSTSEVVVELLETMGIALTQQTACCLYAGIAYDTGNFSYSNTSSQALLTASALVAQGVDVSAIVDQLFRSRTTANFLLTGRAIQRTVFDGGLAHTYITLNDLKELDAKPSDCDNIVELLRDVKCVEVALFLRETAEEKYKASLRAKSYADVSRVAQQFGGGGHIRAAGCMLLGSLEETTATMVDALRAELK
ncbi:MAG: DHH family phosphoesterase [Christensenellales bacterium]|jgi:phosphoesterase RecJ-like protein